MFGHGKKTDRRFIFASRLAGIVLLGLCVLYTTCNQPMGLGDSIDWEPPVLTLDPGSNPRYVRLGTKLTGTVTDNIRVDRVILREAGKTEEMFRARLLPNDRWEIELVFSADRNGEKLAVEVVAFDRGGNSGESSIAAITLIIDIRPPVIEDAWVQRTSVRTGNLEPYYDLKDLERTDPRGEQSGNVNRYQNGWFHIHAKVSEDETRIESVALKIYDTRDSNNPILELQKEDNSTLYAPRWFIKEDDILAAGNKIWPNYTRNYDNGERYYYRVDMVATDRAENSNDEIEIVEEQNYFCMWIKGDEPKGIFDPLIGTAVPKGTPLPVEIFDDDSLHWAYTDLFKADYWNNNVSGTSDEQKIDWLKQQLVDLDATVNNWDNKKIVDRIGGKAINEQLIIVPTGNSDNDYGDYVLFTLVQDKKLPPHLGEPGCRVTNESMWRGRVWRISVVDDNLPTIVFDTVDILAPDYRSDRHPGFDTLPGASTGNSPEENTFPKLDIGGQKFIINGYTLREDSIGGPNGNRVLKFRMAWIPYGMPGGADSHVQAVKDALKRGSGYPEGVQYWHFVDSGAASGQRNLINGTIQTIGSSSYRKQVFTKTFDVLGGPDDMKPSEYQNFHYKAPGETVSALENETKLFVFYAEDNLGEQRGVYRTIRLLGMKSPPRLRVFDISNLEVSLPNLPILNDYDRQGSPYNGNGNGTIEQFERDNYEAALKIYQATGYTQMRTLGMSAATEAPAYQLYARGTTLKYWVKADMSGEIAVASITMDDITNNPSKYDVGSKFNNDNASYITDRAISYCESLPEVTQRVFLFTATDTLGNRAQIQRTVAITSQAFLNDITTAEQNGTYGLNRNAGNPIKLRANFSGQVRYTVGPGNSRPQLNVRYPTGSNDSTSTTYTYASLNCTTPPNTPVLALEFDFVVPVNAKGELETLYNLPEFGTGDTRDRPIRLNGARILDAVRGDDAFTPGNSTSMGNWNDNTHSLQKIKEIKLDGIRPEIKLVGVSGKSTYQSNEYYFKATETISFTLTGDEPIKPLAVNSANPRLQYYIRDTGNQPNNTRRGPYTTAFTYQRPDGNDKIVFSLPVNDANLTYNGTRYNGELVDVSLYTGAGTIADDVDNSVVSATVESLIPTGTRIYIKQTIPVIPDATLEGAAFGSTPDTTIYYSKSPELLINPAPAANRGPGNIAWEDRIEYSLNGGQKWVPFPQLESGWTIESASSSTLLIISGTWDLRVRYVDRAGNNGTERRQLIQVNSEFPKLLSVTAEQPNGTYTRGQTLRFILGFDGVVSVPTRAAATITLSDRSLTGQYRTAPLTNNAVVNTNFSSTVTIEWPLTGDWEMPNGLYVSAVNFIGLRDRFSNAGVSSNSATTANIVMPNTPVTETSGTYPVTNLSTGLIVDTVVPTVDTYSPANARLLTDNITTSVLGADNKTITLTFRENVMKGNGTITVKPYGDYRIPAVFDDEGSTKDGSYYAGFYEIYNTPGLTAAQRNALTQGTTVSNNSNSTVLDNSNPSMSRLRLDERTGQSVGPYIKTTQGLINGAGYTGNYTNTPAPPNTTPSAFDGPNPQPGFMVPDTATKWVLDYRYSIDNANNTSTIGTNNAVVNTSADVVPAIRAVLTAAKWRWQELDVISSSIVINGRTVTITLPESLHKGLQWSLHYPEGTFTDAAANKAPSLGYSGTTISTYIPNTDTSSHWFWSSGVQTPVIRVNRKSFDARNTNWVGAFIPAGGTGANANAVINPRYNVPEARGGPGGWGIADFNTVHYRIETETPGSRVRIFYNTIDGKTFVNNTVPIGSVIVAGGNSTDSWGVPVQYAGTATGTTTGRNWNSNDNSTEGEWVRPNLIRRGSGGNRTYEITAEYGHPSVTRTIQGTYYGYRSHNKDATLGELNGIQLNQTINGGISNGLNYFSYTALEASKNYVVAEARIDYQNANYQTQSGAASAKGYEGAFRSVVAMMQGGTNNAVLSGSNVLKGMPTIAGFPVRDTAESGDARFVKMFYRDGQQFYWVSTEIVSQWYMLKWGQGTHQSVGDANNQLTAGYGDLSFAYLLLSSNNTP